MLKFLLVFASLFMSFFSVAHSKSRLFAVVELRANQGNGTEKKILLSTDLEVYEDGAVYVTETTLRRGSWFSGDEISTKTERFGTYKSEDILNLKNFVSEIKTKLPLVEVNEPYLCESGSFSYRVYKNQELITLKEINDCAPNRVRKGAGEEDARVLVILEDLQNSYLNFAR